VRKAYMPKIAWPLLDEGSLDLEANLLKLAMEIKDRPWRWHFDVWLLLVEVVSVF
jgi:hypothetical protein